MLSLPCPFVSVSRRPVSSLDRGRAVLVATTFLNAQKAVAAKKKSHKPIITSIITWKKHSPDMLLWPHWWTRGVFKEKLIKFSVKAFFFLPDDLKGGVCTHCAFYSCLRYERNMTYHYFHAPSFVWHCTWVFIVKVLFSLICFIDIETLQMSE